MRRGPRSTSAQGLLEALSTLSMVCIHVVALLGPAYVLVLAPRVDALAPPPQQLTPPRLAPLFGRARREGAAATRVRAYFDAWNARDMRAAVAQWTEDCVYEDTQYAGAFEGTAALKAHLDRVADALPETFVFVVDDLADGGESVGVRWHVEAEGAALPFARGASVYRADPASGLLAEGFDVPEPAPLKPGGAGLALLSGASKLIDEPVRALPLVCFVLYCQQLFFAEGQLLPGPSALALDGATWREVRDLSLNFWQIGPALFPAGFPVAHPMLEGLFNVVLAWSALFFGFAADGRPPRPPMAPTLAGMQFLTNAFFLPYLALRPRDDGAVVEALGPVETVAESKAVPLVLGGVVAWSLYWACAARPEFGDLATRWASFQQLLAGDRLGSSFVVDLLLYAAFQSWLVPDDLNRRGVVASADRAAYRALAAVPLVGLVGYLLARPEIRVADPE